MLPVADTADSRHAAGVRFYLDENLSQQIAVIARSLGVDVTSAQELGRLGIEDEDQLAFAAGEARCIVSRDYKDFPQLTEEFRRHGRPHHGVLSVSPSLHQRGAAAVATALARYDREHLEGMLAYEFGWLTFPSEAS